MAKKQTRRSISVSRTTYEKLKAFCETNNISMSQFVETRVGDFLGEGVTTPMAPTTPKPFIPARPMLPIPPKNETRSMGVTTLPSPAAAVAAPAQQIPMTSAAARFAVEPPPPVIKKQEQAAPKPAEKRPDQIFTF
ncbi:MAG TPA: hypothetical protein VH143_28665 [Kofleriaceae bacterium]|jgi:hypothetical protein|nr:hypothetical protein [Kofleriaceae bacterium]